jgi:hypothetical protein
VKEETIRKRWEGNTYLDSKKNSAFMLDFVNGEIWLHCEAQEAHSNNVVVRRMCLLKNPGFASLAEVEKIICDVDIDAQKHRKRLNKKPDFMIHFTVKSTPKGATVTMQTHTGRVETKKFRNGLMSGANSAKDWVRKKCLSLLDDDDEDAPTIGFTFDAEGVEEDPVWSQWSSKHRGRS